MNRTHIEDVSVSMLMQLLCRCFGYTPSGIDKQVSILASVLGRRLQVLSTAQANVQHRPFANADPVDLAVRFCSDPTKSVN